jgi:hypothetical protein
MQATVDAGLHVGETGIRKIEPIFTAFLTF